MSFDHLVLERRGHARAGRRRLGPVYGGSVELARSRCKAGAMPAASHCRPDSWTPLAGAGRTPSQQQAAIVDASEEWEFSEAMRSPRFPAGWFMLPSALLGCILLLAVLR
jgi:hypothetical protein